MKKELFVARFDQEKGEYIGTHNGANVLDMLNTIALISRQIRNEVDDSDKKDLVEKLMQLAIDGNTFYIDENNELSVGK